MAEPRQGVLRAWLRRHRNIVKLAGDAPMWAMGLTFAVWARYEFAARPVEATKLLAILPIAAGFQVAIGWLIGLYRGAYRYGTFDELAPLAATVLSTTALLLVA